MTTTIEEILFREYSRGWGCNMPITLITYDSGEMDLHCQTGDHHSRAIEKAKEILKERGLRIASGIEFIGPTGAYYRVEKIN